jgi:hypothetical protein
MMDLAQLPEWLARIEAKLDSLGAQPKPHLTQVKFAKLAGLSRTTVRAKIDANQIRTEKGRIPYSELRKFVS